MTGRNVIVHEVRVAWTDDQIAFFGEGALRQTARNELRAGALCSLDGAHNVQTSLRRILLGMVAHATAECSDPLCFDLAAAAPGNSPRDEDS